MSHRDDPIFSKWIWIVPMIIFFATMFFGLAFYDTTPSTNAPFDRADCINPNTAQTRVCP